MKTVGIIAEYNPFHKGHAYQLQKAKELSGADYAVIVMSGDFVQRGYPAIVDKYVRAEMALRAGADLVIELPVSYAVGSAEAFAQGAVSVLEALGCVDFLCFGASPAIWIRFCPMPGFLKKSRLPTGLFCRIFCGRASAFRLPEAGLRKNTGI